MQTRPIATTVGALALAALCAGGGAQAQQPIVLQW